MIYLNLLNKKQMPVKHFKLVCMVSLLLGLTLSCEKDILTIEPQTPAYTQQEFEEACSCLLYENFISGEEMNLETLISFLSKPNLPEDIWEKVFEYVDNDYKTKNPEPMEPVVGDEASLKSYHVNIYGKSLLMQRYNYYRWRIQQSIHILERLYYPGNRYTMSLSTVKNTVLSLLENKWRFRPPMRQFVRNGRRFIIVIFPKGYSHRNSRELIHALLNNRNLDTQEIVDLMSGLKPYYSTLQDKANWILEVLGKFILIKETAIRSYNSDYMRKRRERRRKWYDGFARAQRERVKKEEPKLKKPKPPVDLNKPLAGNPVKNPEIAPQKVSGIKGGMYGWTRSNGTKFHNGVDLKNPHGAPIYAMYDGTAKLVTQYDKTGKIIEGAGHYVEVTSTIKGKTVKVLYFHMQKGKRFSGKVKAGTIIGYQGDSGNLKAAIEKGTCESHLHIKVKENGKEVDPIPYLRTKFDPKTGKVIKP
jgi:murein DD-endopeptidase MepM/ murein hydrolase activator NlpD